MRLAQLLFSQGFGTRRECDALIRLGLVEHGGRVADDPDEEVAAEGFAFRVRGEDWVYRAKALLMLNKPAGFECSRKPRHHPSVMSLLPAPLRRRDVQPIGRLDADTTGLLLLSDDGALIHELTSPKRHVPKVYLADCAEPADSRLAARLRDGVMLNDEPLAVRAAACRCIGPSRIELTLTEGKYHQVKRMVAAAGNRVLKLHRCRIGNLDLPDDLPPGQWRWVDRSCIAGGLQPHRPAAMIAR